MKNITLESYEESKKLHKKFIDFCVALTVLFFVYLAGLAYIITSLIYKIQLDNKQISVMPKGLINMSISSYSLVIMAFILLIASNLFFLPRKYYHSTIEQNPIYLYFVLTETKKMSFAFTKFFTKLSYANITNIKNDYDERYNTLKKNLLELASFLSKYDELLIFDNKVHLVLTSPKEHLINNDFVVYIEKGKEAILDDLEKHLVKGYDVTGISDANYLKVYSLAGHLSQQPILLKIKEYDENTSSIIKKDNITFEDKEHYAANILKKESLAFNDKTKVQKLSLETEFNLLLVNHLLKSKDHYYSIKRYLDEWKVDIAELAKFIHKMPINNFNLRLFLQEYINEIQARKSY